MSVKKDVAKKFSKMMGGIDITEKDIIELPDSEGRMSKVKVYVARCEAYVLIAEKLGDNIRVSGVTLQSF